MDFLDPKKKKAHRVKLFIGYGLVAVAIGLTTHLMYLVTSGFGYDRNTGTIVQNGLVFVNAHPEAATMYINGEEKGTTDGRFVLEEGSYNLELRRTGYRSWTHDFDLGGAKVERFIYPFLFPQKLVTKDIQAYDAQPDLVTESPDRHWIITHVPSSFNTFTQLDATAKDTPATTFVVPPAILPPHPNAKLELVEWSTDDRHVLVKSTYDGGASFVMVDRQTPADSIDVTAAFADHPFTQIMLRDKRYDQLYAYESGGLLERVDLKTKVVEAVAQHVLAFFPYGDNTLLYVTDAGAEDGKAVVKLVQGNNAYTLRSVPKSPKYLLNIAEFDGQMYVAVGTSVESQAYVYADPIVAFKKGIVVPSVRALLKVTNGGEFLNFSTNARFLALQGGSEFAVYDAENKRQFRYNTNLPTAEHEKANWMDGHRLTLVSQAKLHVFDFDGTNSQELNAAYAGVVPMFDRDYTALFTLSPSVSTANKPALVRTSLLLKQ